jgi:hypothetical protein
MDNKTCTEKSGSEKECRGNKNIGTIIKNVKDIKVDLTHHCFGELTSTKLN